MSLTLLAPVLLSAVVPELSQRNQRLPALEALCATGAISVVDQPPEHWLCAQLGVRVETEPPLAALRLATEANLHDDANRAGYWLCADPVATTMGIESVRIDPRSDDLSAEQALALTQSLSEFFAQDGLHFTAADASRWYVRCNSPQRIVTTPLWRALGGSMLEQMPTGEDAPAWRARLNAAQMLLHAHPVNAAREAMGLRAVTSIWWWGGGAAPAYGPAQFDALGGGPRWVRAASAANGIEWLAAAGESAPALVSDAGRVLYIVGGEWEDVAADSTALPRWDEGWLAPLRSALESGRLDAATLLFPWEGGLLRIELGPARATGWRRWFGFAVHPAPAPPLAESLRAFAP